MDISAFTKKHAVEITATVCLVSYSIAGKKLTNAGVLAGILVAVVHMLHPWPAFFWLLISFFLLGTLVTKLGHKEKAKHTVSSTGGAGGEGARTAAQVFANSGFASILILLHAYLLMSTPFISSNVPISAGPYFPTLQKVLPIGIITQYAAVAADTFSSELGILGPKPPVMITNPWKEVPRGTNGAVTLDGILLGMFGSFLTLVVAIFALDYFPPHLGIMLSTCELIVLVGAFGSLFDSLLGALVQVTVTDKGSGKVIEGKGGQRVKVVEGGSRLQVGRDLLTNNGVNFVMAVFTSLLAISIAWIFEMEL